MKLYEITASIRDLGEFDDNEQTSLALQELTESFQDKALNIGKLTKEINADIEGIENEVHRLLDRKQALLSKVEWFKEYLKSNMIQAELTNIKDSIITISIRNNPPSCEIADPRELPELYRHAIIMADKKGILELFKTTGEIVQGAKIITDKKRIEIR